MGRWQERWVFVQLLFAFHLFFSFLSLCSFRCDSDFVLVSSFKFGFSWLSFLFMVSVSVSALVFWLFAPFFLAALVHVLLSVFWCIFV